MNNYDDISILIVGFDGYIDVWNHCVNLMNKYWSERPKTYLVDSVLNPQYENVEIINAGEGSEWSRKVQVALSKINTPYVLLMLEDFFISDYINNDEVLKTLELVKDNQIKFYQLLVQLINPKWEKGKPYKGNKRIHVVPHDKKYGVNLQAAIWQTDYLRESVGSENYNAWQFEIKQLERKDFNINKIEFLIDDRNPLNITHAVVQSKYLRSAIRTMNKKGYLIDTNERKCLSVVDDFKYNFKLLMYSLTPSFLIKPFKNIGRMMRIDFVTDRVK